MKTICAVYVTFSPDFDLLNLSISSLSCQVDKIIVVDNTPGGGLLDKIQSDNVEIIYLGENLGIAFAQNVGIQKAMDTGASFITLSDQDTVYPKGFIQKMVPHFEKFPSAAAIVPRFKDSNKKRIDGFIANKSFRFQQFFPDGGQHKIFQAIASGKILKAEFLYRIGLMDERLFIDWVDLEWCWRARARGFDIIGNADVVIDHQLGDVSSNIGFREVNLRSPIRHYYITRNAFYLALHSKDLDCLHRLNLFVRSFRYILGFPILSSPRWKNLKAVLLGFLHGVKAKLGRLEKI